MEAKLVSPKRERCSEANVDNKRPRPCTTSARIVRHLVKDLRSHRVFSPSSDLYREMLDSNFAFQFGPLDLDAASKSARDGGLGKCSEAKAVSNSDAKIKPFIQPCFQRRVFKNPGSVSYRKLLPYLMDIAKQEPCELEIYRSPEVAMDLEGKEPEALVSFQGDETLNDAGAVSLVEDGKNTEVDSSPISEDSHLGKGGEPSQETEVTNSIILHPNEDGKQNGNEFRNYDKVIVNQVDNDNVEICGGSEVTNSVAMHPIEDEKQNENKTGGDGEVISNHIYSDDVQLCRNSEVINPVIMYPIDEKQNKNKSGDDDEVTANQMHDDNVELCRDSEVTSVTKHLIDGEPNQMTPPDVDIFQSFAVEGNESDRPDHVQNRGLLWGIESDKVHRKISCLANSARHEFNSKISGVFKPQSQVKLFRTPGSFSYKRMLPFIMDIARENSDASPNGQSEKQLSLYKLHNSEFKERHADESVILPQREIENSDTESRMRLSSYKEDILQVKEVVPIEEQAVSRTVLGSDCARSGGRDKLQYTQSLLSSLVSSRNEADCPNKGILRRNPRGCRGLCTCLNCASFRLHAERAFEFSRNQMEDTEELVLDLADELACLRGMLEKSVDLGDNEVKEACRKSWEVEDVAKKRLSEMKYNLGIHCRITCVERPSVRFKEMDEAKSSENKD